MNKTICRETLNDTMYKVNAFNQKWNNPLCKSTKILSVFYSNLLTSMNHLSDPFDFYDLIYQIRVGIIGVMTRYQTIFNISNSTTGYHFIKVKLNESQISLQYFLV